jgi:hypothetical protein
LWSSIQFTIDNNLDIDTSATAPDPNNDVFRRVRDITISPDGKYLVVHKSSADSGANVGLGDGAVYLIPLDANGIPDIDVQGGLITNVLNIETLGDNGAHNSGAQVEYDAAGNLYVANSSISTTTTDPLLTGQLVQVFSPGGSWIATTSSNGTFDLAPFAAPNADYNNDGIVDLADYVAWRKDPSSFGGDPAGYDAWKASFGESAAGSGGAIPEPGACLLAAAGLLILAGGSRRR